MNLHFTIGSKLDSGNVRLEWVCMPLKSDLINNLKKVGTQIPLSDTQLSIQDLQALRDLWWLGKRKED